MVNKKLRLKVATAFALATFVLSNIIPFTITKAHAAFVNGSPPKKTVRVMKKCKDDLKTEFDYKVGGKTLHYKRVSDISTEYDFSYPELAFKFFREFKTYYLVKPKIDSSSGRGYYYGSPTNYWDSDKDTSKIVGDDGAKFPDGYVKGYKINPYKNNIGKKSLIMPMWGMGMIWTEDDKTQGGKDFLNKTHDITDESSGVTWKMTTGGDFFNNIKVSTTKEAICEMFKLDPYSDIDPNDFSNRTAYIENRVGKKDGIHYGTYEDYLPNNPTITGKKGKNQWGAMIDLYTSSTFVIPAKTGRDKNRWRTVNGVDYLVAGIYGNETFNYYVPTKLVGTVHYADYEIEDIKVTPDPPQPPDKPDTSPCGRITYNPDKCNWTNRGKISNGVGDYSVDIEATKPHIVLKGKTRSHDKCTRCGKHSCHTYTCHKSRDTFDVTYDLDRIESSGATNDTVRGGKGTIHIRQEGGGQEVRSTGYWKRPSYRPYYSQPYHDGCTMPKDPCNPQGHAGIYDIDWSDPIIQVQQKAPNKWKNNPYYQPIDVTVTDNLSGFNSSKSYIKITDISHYKHNYFTNLSEASLNEVKHWDLADGIYQIDIIIYDRAGNHSEYHDKWFKVDGIAPDINISNQGYHRAIDSLTFDTTVSDNIEELDELTVSGWGTYGSSKATLENQTKVVRPITYPNIKHEDTNYTFYYKVEDLATNQTTKSFVTSVVREYWKWAHTVYGKNFDTEVPIKILSSKDTKSLEGFTRSRTIDFDTWRGMKVEVWYKFVSYHNCNFIRVIHYDDPAMPVITGNGEKLYPDGKGGFKDAPPLSNEIGLEVGMDEYVESFGKHTDPKPIKTVDNGDGTVTNYYVNGDVRVIDKGGNLSTWKDKGFGTIIPETTEHEENRTIYHTSNRYRIEVTYNGSGSTIVVFDKNDKIVMRTSASR